MSCISFVLQAKAEFLRHAGGAYGYGGMLDQLYPCEVRFKCPVTHSSNFHRYQELLFEVVAQHLCNGHSTDYSSDRSTVLAVSVSSKVCMLTRQTTGNSTH